jgi:hypothetical protein
MTELVLALLWLRPNAWPISCAATVNRSYVEPTLNVWPVLNATSPAME